MSARRRDEISLSEQETNSLHEKLQHHMIARKRLDDINVESKALRAFLAQNGEDIAAFIQIKRMKSCKVEGANLRPITKTIKVKPKPDQIWAAITEIFNDEAMLKTIQEYVDEKYIKPKEKTKTVLKIVRLKRPAAKAHGRSKSVDRNK